MPARRACAVFLNLTALPSIARCPASGFSLNYAVNAIAMPLIGGTSSWLGPVIGAVLVGGLQEYLRVTISSAVNVLVAGVLMVAFVIAAPQGIVGLFQRKRK